jgi:chemotaxis response regulator CheB
VEFCAKDTPDLVLMDLLMPVMDGIEATRKIMAGSPCAILVVTVSVGANAWRVFEAMGHGALDAVDTPALGTGDPRESAAPLLAKIDIIGRLIGDRSSGTQSPLKPAEIAVSAARSNRLLAIGASAGGPAAVAKVLSGLPKDFPAAVVVIQHVDEQFAAGMADWLGRDSKLPVRVALEGERPVTGEVLLAGTNDHLTLLAGGTLGYTPRPREYVYRPSVDVFFQSVTRHWTGEAVGVLLTGMGRDGAVGLKAMRNQGRYTVAQDQASCAVYGMPKAAATLDAAVDILPLDRIAPQLTTVFAAKKYGR